MTPRATTAVNTRSGQYLARDLRVARSAWLRLRGLLGSRGLPPGTGLLIEPCFSIHTVGMRFPLDLVFLDRGGRVLRLEHALPPGHLIPWVRSSRRVLELPAGTLARTGTVVGDIIELAADAGGC